jgi:hypothetical protein
VLAEDLVMEVEAVQEDIENPYQVVLHGQEVL